MIGFYAYLSNGCAVVILGEIKTANGEYFVVSTDYGTGCVPKKYMTNIQTVDSSDLKAIQAQYPNKLSPSEIKKANEANNQRAKQKKDGTETKGNNTGEEEEYNEEQYMEEEEM